MCTWCLQGTEEAVGSPRTDYRWSIVSRFVDAGNQAQSSGRGTRAPLNHLSSPSEDLISSTQNVEVSIGHIPQFVLAEEEERDQRWIGHTATTYGSWFEESNYEVIKNNVIRQFGKFRL